MRKTLPKPAAPVNSNATEAGYFRQVQLRWQLLIWGGFGGLALVGYLTGLETWLAQAVYQPNLSDPLGWWAWQLREYGASIPGYLAGAALLLILVPRLWRLRPMLYQTAAVVVLSAVFGAGLINQVLIQDLADRHRPRETLLVGQSPLELPAELKGHSMPSGHAAMGFLLGAPAFMLARRRPRWAQGFLALGLLGGAVVGGGRMVLGAHYLSDVLIAGALVFSTAALAAWTLARWERIPYRLLVLGATLAVAGVVLGNRFTLELTHKFSSELAEPLPNLDLPCPVDLRVTETQNPPTLTLEIEGYGAPLSQLRLREESGILSLGRGFGAFHSLECRAILTLPPRFD